MKDLPHPPWAQQIQWWHPLTQQQLWKIPHSNQPFRCRKCTVESCQSLSGLILPCSPPGDTLGELECSPEQHMRSCLASGRTISHLLPPSLSIPSHLYYSGTLSSVQSHQLHQTGSGSGWYRACTRPPGCKREAFSPLCESNKYSARDSLAFLIISGALGADLHPRQDPIRSQDLPEQSSDKWNPLWWHILFPHQVLFLHFLPELSVSTFPQPWLSPLCAPQVP